MSMDVNADIQKAIRDSKGCDYMGRLIDADAFEMVGTKIPDGMDVESYMAGMCYILSKIDDAPTVDAIIVGVDYNSHDYNILVKSEQYIDREGNTERQTVCHKFRVEKVKG